jgi:hypothetical protein
MCCAIIIIPQHYSPSKGTSIHSVTNVTAMKACEEIFHDTSLSLYHGRGDYMSRKKGKTQNSDALCKFTQVMTIKTVGR